MLTDTALDALEAKAKAATPGPWDCTVPYAKCFVSSAKGKTLCKCEDWGKSISSENNAAYIAAANPATVLELIAELRQARAELNWLAEKLARIARIYHMSMGLKNHEYWLDAARVGVEEQGGTPHVSESD